MILKLPSFIFLPLSRQRQMIAVVQAAWTFDFVNTITHDRGDVVIVVESVPAGGRSSE